MTSGLYCAALHTIRSLSCQQRPTIQSLYDNADATTTCAFALAIGTDLAATPTDGSDSTEETVPSRLGRTIKDDEQWQSSEHE
jgi:hypothetical protein